MANMITYTRKILENPDNRMIIFSQWDSMLKLIKDVLEESKITYTSINGSYYTVNKRIRDFKINTNIRIALLSSDKGRLVLI